ncbi:MAG TPA: ribosome biogenesis factor YjgA [Burkholderiales bacterium]|nr:ribosome biogenesis factor YjgA [Burkholderiales bacterium]
MDRDTEISKTQRKREMHELQELGEALVRLPAERLAGLDLPESLREAVLEARRIVKWGARRRQLQYIGRLMRDADAPRIRAQIEGWRSDAARQAARLHQTERWRDRLLEDEAALGELLERFPAADLQRLRTLIRNALQEAASGKPPKSARALFQALRELMVEDAPL